VATNELAKLASTVERQTTADGVYDTAVPGLTLYRSSAPSDHDAAVYEPCLVIVAQGSKEVLLGGERCRHDPADVPRVPATVERSLDLATLTPRESQRLDGHHVRMRVDRESRPGDAGGAVVYDGVSPDDVNRTIWLIPGQEARDSTDVEGVFRLLWRQPGNGFPGYWEYRVEGERHGGAPWVRGGGVLPSPYCSPPEVEDRQDCASPEVRLGVPQS
jgi:hypothetical protein